MCTSTCCRPATCSEPFTYHDSVSRPFGHIVGALGMFIGGVNVTSPIGRPRTSSSCRCWPSAATRPPTPLRAAERGDARGNLRARLAADHLTVSRLHARCAADRARRRLGLAGPGREGFSRVRRGGASLASRSVSVCQSSRCSSPQFLAVSFWSCCYVADGETTERWVRVFADRSRSPVGLAPGIFVHLSEFSEITRNRRARAFGYSARQSAGDMVDRPTSPGTSGASSTLSCWRRCSSSSIGGSLWTAVMVVRRRGAQRTVRGLFLAGGFRGLAGGHARLRPPRHSLRHGVASLPRGSGSWLDR